MGFDSMMGALKFLIFYSESLYLAHLTWCEWEKWDYGPKNGNFFNVTWGVVYLLQNTNK